MFELLSLAGRYEASVLVRPVDRASDLAGWRQATYPVRHLLVHHQELSLLPHRRQGLAKLHSSQPQFKQVGSTFFKSPFADVTAPQVFRQGSSIPRGAWQGLLLEDRPSQRGEACRAGVPSTKTTRSALLPHALPRHQQERAKLAQPCQCVRFDDPREFVKRRQPCTSRGLPHPGATGPGSAGES